MWSWQVPCGPVLNSGLAGSCQADSLQLSSFQGPGSVDHVGYAVSVFLVPNTSSLQSILVQVEKYLMNVNSFSVRFKQKCLVLFKSRILEVTIISRFTYCCEKLLFFMPSQVLTKRGKQFRAYSHPI